MKRCKICGEKTKPWKKICYGCYNLKKVHQKKTKASKTEIETATSHLLKTGKNLSLIVWQSFDK